MTSSKPVRIDRHPGRSTQTIGLARELGTDPDLIHEPSVGVAGNGGIHPNCGIADTRLLHRARHTAVPATRGGGLHPNREVWVREPRSAERSGFVPKNRHRPQANRAS